MQISTTTNRWGRAGKGEERAKQISGFSRSIDVEDFSWMVSVTWDGMGMGSERRRQVFTILFSLTLFTNLELV